MNQLMTALSPHFSLEEMTASQEAVRKGIDNTPSPFIIERLRETCTQLEVARGLIGQPLIVSSGYRSPALNALLGGAPDSAHCQGFAVDFICPAYGDPLKICKAIDAAHIPFDQLIQEGANPEKGYSGWVHISFAIPMRQEVLTASFTATGTHYQEGFG